jgi:hypothetical protein
MFFFRVMVITVVVAVVLVVIFGCGDSLHQLNEYSWRHSSVNRLIIDGMVLVGGGLWFLLRSDAPRHSAGKNANDRPENKRVGKLFASIMGATLLVAIILVVVFGNIHFSLYGVGLITAYVLVRLMIRWR